MKRGRNYTVGERAIIAIGVASGLDIESINLILEKEQEKLGSEKRPLNEKSFTMLKENYLPTITGIDNHKNPCDETEEQWEKSVYLQKTFIALLHHILSPKTLGGIKK